MSGYLFFIHLKEYLIWCFKPKSFSRSIVQAVHHSIASGIERGEIFQDDFDRDNLLVGKRTRGFHDRAFKTVKNIFVWCKPFR